jgi:hypothetical protein
MKAYSDGVSRSLLPQTLGAEECVFRLPAGADLQCALQPRQPPPRLLAMICLNMALSVGALMTSPWRIATVRAVLLRWPAVVIPRRVRDKPAVVTEDADVVPGQQRTDVALTHELLLPGPLDGFRHLRPKT